MCAGVVCDAAASACELHAQNATKGTACCHCSDHAPRDTKPPRALRLQGLLKACSTLCSGGMWCCCSCFAMPVCTAHGALVRFALLCSSQSSSRPSKSGLQCPVDPGFRPSARAERHVDFSKSGAPWCGHFAPGGDGCCCYVSLIVTRTGIHRGGAIGGV